MGENEFRRAIRGHMESLNDTIEENLRRELSEPIDLGHSGRLQFEICPTFYGIRLIQADEEILPDYAIDDVIPKQLLEAADETDFDKYNAFEDELLHWFADRWDYVNGPRLYHPAYAYFHGGLEKPRFDLEQRRWFSVEEVFGE